MALDRKAPAHGAEKLCGRKPKDYKLPQIRSASDITWAFWNRATAGVDIKNIKYFFNCLIVNEETQDLIRQAHGKLTPLRSAPETWPGTEFSMDSEQGLALLGELDLSFEWFHIVANKVQAPLSEDHMASS